ncbi:DUF6308 family protein [Sinomonas mesophila]|uniref:DUF6308 family protein n=1 Tax=Sinomonas mesophila TaxID=1531955 RepID=UPI001115A470|nr:DUF6308 family protein [Sinomonas mesophila]
MAITLTASLAPGAEVRAVKVLRHCFAHIGGTRSGFTGGCWDAFDPSGMRTASTNTFTSDDLIACSLLSSPIGGGAAVSLLQGRRREFEVLLEQIGPDRDFITLDTTEGSEFAPVRALYTALCSLPRIGQTHATKLLARKRPRLVPIIDQVILEAVFNGAPRQWQLLHEEFRAEDNALWNRLIRLREAAGLGVEVPIMRVFDVLAWMDGSGNSERALGNGAIVDTLDPTVQLRDMGNRGG